MAKSNLKQKAKTLSKQPEKRNFWQRYKRHIIAANIVIGLGVIAGTAYFSSNREETKALPNQDDERIENLVPGKPAPQIGVPHRLPDSVAQKILKDVMTQAAFENTFSQGGRIDGGTLEFMGYKKIPVVNLRGIVSYTDLNQKKYVAILNDLNDLNDDKTFFSLVNAFPKNTKVAIDFPAVFQPELDKAVADPAHADRLFKVLRDEINKGSGSDSQKARYFVTIDLIEQLIRSGRKVLAFAPKNNSGRDYANSLVETLTAEQENVLAIVHQSLANAIVGLKTKVLTIPSHTNAGFQNQEDSKTPTYGNPDYVIFVDTTEKTSVIHLPNSNTNTGR